jgi:hypothetical protein
MRFRAAQRARAEGDRQSGQYGLYGQQGQPETISELATV